MPIDSIKNKETATKSPNDTPKAKWLSAAGATKQTAPKIIIPPKPVVKLSDLNLKSLANGVTFFSWIGWNRDHTPVCVSGKIPASHGAVKPTDLLPNGILGKIVLQAQASRSTLVSNIKQAGMSATAESDKLTSWVMNGLGNIPGFRQLNKDTQTEIAKNDAFRTAHSFNPNSRSNLIGAGLFDVTISLATGRAAPALVGKIATMKQAGLAAKVANRAIDLGNKPAVQRGLKIAGGATIVKDVVTGDTRAIVRDTLGVVPSALRAHKVADNMRTKIVMRDGVDKVHGDAVLPVMAKHNVDQIPGIVYRGDVRSDAPEKLRYIFKNGFKPKATKMGPYDEDNDIEYMLQNHINNNDLKNLINTKIISKDDLKILVSALKSNKTRDGFTITTRHVYTTTDKNYAATYSLSGAATNNAIPMEQAVSLRMAATKKAYLFVIQSRNGRGIKYEDFVNYPSYSLVDPEKQIIFPKSINGEDILGVIEFKRLKGLTLSEVKNFSKDNSLNPTFTGNFIRNPYYKP